MTAQAPIFKTIGGSSGGSTDIADTIARIQEMGDLLRDVAIETLHDKPDVAARAAMGRARVASDVLGTMMVREQLDGLFERIGLLKAQRRGNARDAAMHCNRSDPVIGFNKDGKEVRRPEWGRGGSKDKLTVTADARPYEQADMVGSNEPDGTTNGDPPIGRRRKLERVPQLRM